jgi:hypothetical protein
MSASYDKAIKGKLSFKGVKSIKYRFNLNPFRNSLLRHAGRREKQQSLWISHPRIPALIAIPENQREMIL